MAFMWTKRITMVASVLGVLAASGCNQQSLKDEVSLLKNENTELRGQLIDRDGALETGNDELRNAHRSMRDQQEAFDSERDTWTAAQTNAFDNIQGVQATYGPNDVTVTVEGDVLFSSGKTGIRSTAKNSLDRVAAVLKNDFGGKQIVIAGHTDTDPIKKSGHKSNHHLGFERGWAVRDYLASKGVNSDSMAIISYGPDRPMGSSTKSRRVEIVVAE